MREIYQNFYNTKKLKNIKLNSIICVTTKCAREREGRNILQNLGAQFVGRSALLQRVRSPKLSVQGDPLCTANKSAIVYQTAVTCRVILRVRHKFLFQNIALLRGIPGKQSADRRERPAHVYEKSELLVTIVFDRDSLSTRTIIIAPWNLHIIPSYI